MPKGKLIVIEGIDGAGKSTQVKMLAKALKEYGKVTVFKFPRYDKFFGTFVKACLHGKFGDFRNLNPFISALPHILDHASAKDEILEALKQGNVICDRFSPSNMAYQLAKLPDDASENDFLTLHDFLEAADKELGIPKPDLVIILNIPPDVASRLKTKKNNSGKNKQSKDQYEADIKYQEKVASAYDTLVYDKFWHEMNCYNATLSKPLSKKYIHNRILKECVSFLKLKKPA